MFEQRDIWRRMPLAHTWAAIAGSVSCFFPGWTQWGRADLTFYGYCVSYEETAAGVSAGKVAVCRGLENRTI